MYTAGKYRRSIYSKAGLGYNKIKSLRQGLICTIYKTDGSLMANCCDITV